MTWREKLTILEKEHNFDIAIFLLITTIKESTDDRDAYISLLYLLIDTALENGHYFSDRISQHPLRTLFAKYYYAKENEYLAMATKYFHESYERFSSDAEYLDDLCKSDPTPQNITARDAWAVLMTSAESPLHTWNGRGQATHK